MRPDLSASIHTELYELIGIIELMLHTYIKQTFIEKYGEVDWWRKGVPENIRAACAAARELDPEPASHPYCYTTFIQLKEILKNRWIVFAERLPGKLSTDKQYLLSCLQKLNGIRNCVMHPVRDNVLSTEEHQLVRQFKDYLDREGLISHITAS